MNRILGMLVLAVASLALTACQGGDLSSDVSVGENSSDSVAGSDASYTLDREIGAVILPLDRTVPDREDSNLITSAQWAAAAVCAREAGVGFMTDRYVENNAYRAEAFFGPWTIRQAEKYGFVEPWLTDADLVANGVMPEGHGDASSNNPEVSAVNGNLSDEEKAIVEDCWDSPEVKELDVKYGSAPWMEEVEEVDSRFIEGAAGGELFDELYACYREAGMEPAADVPGSVEGADPRVIDEEQIELAVKTVQCKEETQFTERLAKEWAQAQAQVLAPYTQELADQRAELDKLLSAAEAYLADHPEVAEPTR
ncbi:hypothetical protein APR04_001105 [Promicromonospora umidemergens]|nr:hypothetical protein [Promicromonospora umidemergens]MCP2282210.1 hypothetical protein [Promicromonospora umidemergens]